MDNSFSTLLASSNSVLVLVPSSPSFDQVAAALGLYLSLKERKSVYIACPSPMLVEVNRLVGVDRISTDLGSKNLSLRFVGYKASNIEKVSYDIENEEFCLTVIPKAGFVSPTKEQVVFNYSGTSADTVILVGGVSDSDFPAINQESLGVAKLIHVGTQALSTSGTRSIMSFARPSSSVSELVGHLLIEANYNIDPDGASDLLAGIEEGTQNFTHQEVTAETFQMVANLMKVGGRRILKEQYNQPVVPGASPTDLFQQPEKKEQPPQDWLEPKIFKATSVS